MWWPTSKERNQVSVQTRRTLKTLRAIPGVLKELPATLRVSKMLEAITKDSKKPGGGP